MSAVVLRPSGRVTVISPSLTGEMNIAAIWRTASLCHCRRHGRARHPHPQLSAGVERRAEPGRLAGDPAQSQTGAVSLDPVRWVSFPIGARTRARGASLPKLPFTLHVNLPMSAWGHQRHFEHAPGTSALLPTPDLLLSRTNDVRGQTQKLSAAQSRASDPRCAMPHTRLLTTHRWDG